MKYKLLARKNLVLEWNPRTRLVLDRKTNFCWEKDGFVRKNKFLGKDGLEQKIKLFHRKKMAWAWKPTFPRKKILLCRKTNYIRWKIQKQNMISESGRTVFYKIVFLLSEEKFVFLNQSHLFHREKLVCPSKTIWLFLLLGFSLGNAVFIERAQCCRWVHLEPERFPARSLKCGFGLGILWQIQNPDLPK